VETVLGIVPGLGDLFDFAWKANARNLALLEEWQVRPHATRRASAVRVGVVIALLVALAAAVAFAGWQLVSWAVRAIAG
jgi:hypothetical protein